MNNTQSPSGNESFDISPIDIGEFLLDPSITYLNHGGFGATPRVVAEHCEQIRRLCSENPTKFMQRLFEPMLRETCRTLASFLGAADVEIAPLLNVTHGINEIAAALSESLLKASDRVVASDQEYDAMTLAWQRHAEIRGYSYCMQSISLPVRDEATLLFDLWKAVDQKTKVIFVSHINSPTAMIMPVEAICLRAKEDGIYTVIDGAHAPGQVPLQLHSLDADFYSGNLHKWLGIPLTAGFIYCRPELQHLIKPLLISFGFDFKDDPWPDFLRQHYWAGTLDYAPLLSIPAAIKFFQENDWPLQQKRCHALAGEALRAINQITGLEALYPDSERWYGQMAAARLPEDIDVKEFRSRLEEKHKIEVQCHRWRDHNLIRVSFQAYNTENDLDKLITAVRQELK